MISTATAIARPVRDIRKRILAPERASCTSEWRWIRKGGVQQAERASEKVYSWRYWLGKEGYLAWLAKADLGTSQAGFFDNTGSVGKREHSTEYCNAKLNLK